MPLDLLHQQGQIAARRERHNAELVGEVVDDLQGLCSDRPCGTQHADGFHAVPVVLTSLPPGCSIAGKLINSFGTSPRNGSEGAVAVWSGFCDGGSR